MTDQLISRLEPARTGAGLTQAQLGVLVGVSRQTIGAIERGDWSPSTPVALRLAIILDCSVDDLFALPPAEGRELARRAARRSEL